jgi:3'-phosphoadenosine 5'-phosphosulfate sulfotransferase (PAPS reductase)/FAD synthetase
MQETIARHRKIVLQFSGGKDSLACLYLCREFWDHITVLWVNAGDAFPETLAQMEQIKALVPNFLEVQSDQPAHIAAFGWPVDIIPVSNTLWARQYERTDRQIMQGFPLCCGENIWKPMQKAVSDLGATLIIRGVKRSDARRGPELPDGIIGGVEFLLPIFEWSDADVFAYLKEAGVTLPANYSYVSTSLDCRHCTAYLAENAGKMRFIKDRHPELSDEIRSRLEIIAGAVNDEMAALRGAALWAS